jgi:hypothetical protein
MTVPTLSQRQLNRATLARQLLLAREPLDAAGAVRRLAGLQAQEPRPPFVGLWSRLVGFHRTDLLDALRARQLVRATFLRGTLHVLDAGDYRALRATLAPMLAEALRVLGDRATGLDPEKVLPVARELLADRPHTFNELRPRLLERFPEANDRALGFTVRTQLPLVMVPTEDRWGFPRDSAFTLAETWLGGPPAAAEAPEELVLRYLAAFGPASAVDAQTWSGRRGLAAVLDGLRPQLAVFRDERRRELFDLPGAPRPDPDLPAPVRFLPEFDNLLLSHGDRTRVLADPYRGQVFSKNLRVRATFLVDGFVAGSWAVERRRSTATLRLTPFGKLPAKARAELTAEGAALLRFVEEDADTTAVIVDPVP